MGLFRKIRRLYLLGIVAVLLLVAALLRWRFSQRVEPDPQNATYAQLAAAVERDPGNPRLFYYLGLRLCDLGKIPPARAALTRAAELDPDSKDICLARIH